MSNRYSLTLVAVGIAFALSGCVAVWHDSYKVEFASSTSITLNTDPTFINMGEAQRIAEEHCQKYGKDAVPGESQMSPWGLRTISYTCVSR